MSTKRAHRLQISPDPQNLSWTSDKSSFGFRMLQKMGWTEGKGLGSNEDGNVDHVKITKKIDNRGVGASYQTINAWKETNNHFDSLLKTLNDAYGANTSSSEDGESKKRKSSEEDSSSSSESEEEEKKEPAPQVKRIPRHLIYQKRHNAKNVMNYSKTDLSAILARPTDQPKKDHFKKEEDAEIEETNGATYIHKKESMYDYFNKKTKVITNTEEEEERPSFGLGFSSNNGSTNGTAIAFQYNDTNNDENNNTEETQPVKEKKKKKKQVEEPQPVEEEPSKKKKKKSKELVVEEIEMTYTEEQTTEEVKKKKKKKQVEEPQPVEETKKSKKKKKNKSEEVVEEQPAEEAVQEPPRKKKKKSKDVVEEEQPVDEGSKKKKKKQKDAQVVEEVQLEDNTEKKKKKKKKKTEE